MSAISAMISGVPRTEVGQPVLGRTDRQSAGLWFASYYPHQAVAKDNRSSLVLRPSRAEIG